MSYDNRSGGKMHSTVDDEVHVTPDFDGEEYGLSGEKTDVDEKVGDGLGGESYQVTAPDLSYVEDVDIARDLNVTRQDYLDAVDYAKGLTVEATYTILQEVSELHRFDPNFDAGVMLRIHQFLDTPDILSHQDQHREFIQEMKIEAALITDNSPYEVVRAVVPNRDDPNLPTLTVRVWVIGLFFCAIASFVNQFFSQRQPAISLGANVAQLLCFPIAKLWERVMPHWGFNAFGTRIELNPGHFNQKEHMLITIMANAGFNGPITVQFVWIQYLPRFFNQHWAASYGYNICIGLGNTFLGFALAGVTRRFLVYPAHCVWPSLMQTIALNSSFHAEGNPEVIGPFKTRWRASRMKCFLICFVAMFVYFFFPNYIFSAMSMFNWPTWISPNNLVLAAIMGQQSGVGFNPFPTFDWNYATTFINPLATPLFSSVTTFAGTFTTAMVVVGIYFSNAFNTAYLPMNLNGAFDGYGNSYNVSKVLDEHKHFDAEKYVEYTPPYLSAGFLTSYMFNFAIVPAMVSYAYLFHRREIWMAFKSIDFKLRFWQKKKDEDGTEVFLFNDVHNRLMRKYPEVPEWWFVAIGVFASIFSIIGIVHWQTNTSWSVVPFGLAMTLVLTIPSGIITAVTNVEVTYNIAAEFIGGVAYPGDGISMDFFKYFGYYPAVQAISFASDMKLGHYMKVPPRQTFMVQIVGQFVACLVSTGVLLYQFNIPHICDKHQVDKFTCPGVGTTFGATVLWGVLGPQKIFRGEYKWLLLAFPFGFLVPFPLYFLQKKFPRKSILKTLHPIPFFYGGCYFAPYNMSYYWPAIPVAWFSMGYLKNRYIGFFSKYNYVVGAAFGVAIALSGLVMFGLNDRDLSITWWGNTIPYAGLDAAGFTLKAIPDVGFFGPGPGQFGPNDG